MSLKQGGKNKLEEEKKEKKIEFNRRKYLRFDESSKNWKGMVLTEVYATETEYFSASWF